MIPKDASGAGSEPLDALLVVLNDALRALAATGRSDEANRMAGRAYSVLRREHPPQAQRVNVLMHALARIPDTTHIPDTTQGAEHGDHGAAARRPH